MSDSQTFRMLANLNKRTLKGSLNGCLRVKFNIISNCARKEASSLSDQAIEAAYYRQLVGYLVNNDSVNGMVRVISRRFPLPSEITRIAQEFARVMGNVNEEYWGLFCTVWDIAYAGTYTGFGRL